MPVQAYTGPENSMRVAFTDFTTRHIKLVGLSALRTDSLPPYPTHPKEIILVLIVIRVWVDPMAKQWQE